MSVFFMHSVVCMHPQRFLRVSCLLSPKFSCRMLSSCPSLQSRELKQLKATHTDSVAESPSLSDSLTFAQSFPQVTTYPDASVVIGIKSVSILEDGFDCKTFQFFLDPLLEFKFFICRFVIHTWHPQQNILRNNNIQQTRPIKTRSLKERIHKKSIFIQKNRHVKNIHVCFWLT